MLDLLYGKRKIHTIPTIREHIVRKSYLRLFLRTLCSVLGATLLTVCNTLSIESTTNNVITYTGQVTNTATADKNYRVLLKVVSDTGNIGSSFHSVGKSYSGNLTKSRVRLLGGNGSNLGANASLLGCALVGRLIAESVNTSLKHGSLGLRYFIATTFLYELVKGWHDFPPSSKIFRSRKSYAWLPWTKITDKWA